MSANTDFKTAAQNFLVSFAKSFSRVSLYSLNHPLAAESIQQTYQDLTSALSTVDEFTISATPEKRVLLNGETLEGAAHVEQAWANLLGRQGLNSLTFSKDIASQEVQVLYRFFMLREGHFKTKEEAKAFWSAEKVTHIDCDSAVYTMVSGEETATLKGKPAAAGEGGEGQGMNSEAEAQWVKKISQMPLENMIWEVICRAIPDEDERKRIFEIITNRIQTELEEYVKSATQALESQKQKLQVEQTRTESVLQEFAEGSIVVDQEGKIVMMNPVAEKIYGSSLGDMRGKDVSSLNKNEVMVTLATDLKSDNPESFKKEVTVQSQDGTKMIIKNSSAMIQTPDGRIVGVMTMLQDIAQQKELARMQSDFMANVTHELRSPLTAIKAALGSIEVTDPVLLHVIGIANRNIDRLARLINDLLDCAKIGAGKMSVHPRAIDPLPVVRDAVSSLVPWAQSKNIVIGYEAQTNNINEISYVMADPDRLTQILVNLISNAIKFTPKDGKIMVKIFPGTPQMKIAVSDSGPGISKEDQERLFQRFFQAKTAEKSDSPGTGLGLFIAKTFVELHSGQMGLESDLGQGTTFFFTLPITPRPNTQAYNAASQQTAAATAAPTVKKSWIQRLFGK